MTARRCTFVLALLVAVEFFALVLARGMPWRGEWNSTLDHVVGTTVLTGPLVGGFAAWISAEDRQRALLLNSTVRGWLAPVRTAAIATGVGVVAVLIGLAGALLATATVPHGGPFSWWLPAIVVPVLGLNAALGATVGDLWPQRVLVVLVPPGLFFLGALCEFNIGPRGLRQGPTSGSLGGQDFNATDIGLQGLMMVALVVALIGAQAVRRRVRMPVSVPGTVVAVGAFVVASLNIGGFDDDRLVYTDEQPTACTGKAPRVCLLPSNRRSLEPVALQMQRAAGPLIDAGAKVPATYVNAGVRPGPMDSGVLFLPADANVSDYSVEEATQSISAPAPCPAWYARVAPAEEAFAAEQLVSDWLLVQLGEPPVGWSEETNDWLEDTPAEQQAADVVALFEKLRTCQLDDITLPWQR